jgi:hypothetical protein
LKVSNYIVGLFYSDITSQQLTLLHVVACLLLFLACFADLIRDALSNGPAADRYRVGSYGALDVRVGPQPGPDAVYKKAPNMFVNHDFDEIDGVQYMIFFLEGDMYNKLGNLNQYLSFCAAIAALPMCETGNKLEMYKVNNVPYYYGRKKDQYDQTDKIFRADCVMIPVLNRKTTEITNM